MRPYPSGPLSWELCWQYCVSLNVCIIVIWDTNQLLYNIKIWQLILCIPNLKLINWNCVRAVITTVMIHLNISNAIQFAARLYLCQNFHKFIAHKYIESVLGWHKFSCINQDYCTGDTHVLGYALYRWLKFPRYVCVPTHTRTQTLCTSMYMLRYISICLLMHVVMI